MRSMPNRKLISIAVFLAVFLSLAAPDAKAAENITQKKEAPKTRKEFTKEEYIAHIKGNLGRIESLIKSIPGLKKDIDPAGNAIYTYQGKRLEDLDKEQLTKLYVRVSSEATRIRTERLNKQLESMRISEQLAVQNRRITPVPGVPVVPPQPPSTPAQPPKVPPLPLAPPRR